MSVWAVRLDDGVKARLDRLAQRDGTTRSHVIRTLVEFALLRFEADDKTVAEGGQ
jgi:predicted transcriptional regulator